MHLYGILRGNPMLCRRFKENCRDTFIPMEKVQGKKTENFFVQLMPRKVELVEFVFPHNALPDVVKTFRPGWDRVKNEKNWSGRSMMLKMLRKSLGAKKIPDLDLKDKKPLTCRGGDKINVPYADLNLIGIKEDKAADDGYEIL